MLAEIDLSIVPVVISRWIHIGSAIVAIGGTVFLRVVLAPSARATLSDDVHGQLAGVLIRRWARVVHACVAFLLLTGIYNTIIQFPRHQGQPLYHGLWGVKILLALTLFFVAIAITGRSPAFAKLREKRMQWMSVNILLGGVILLISNVLKNLPASLQ